MVEEIGNTEGAENFTLQSFADFKGEVDANLNEDPDFERYLFGDKQSIFIMNRWLTAVTRLRIMPWQGGNWSAVINQGDQASIFKSGGSALMKELAATYRSRKTTWMRQRQASWQQRLKERYIAAWYLERMLPRHEALWAAAQTCPCRSELDRRCPRGSNCYGQRLAAGYYYDKDGNTKIRTCYTVPGGEFQTFQMVPITNGYVRRYRNYNPVEEEQKELSCTDRTTHADHLKAAKIQLANIRDDIQNPQQNSTRGPVPTAAAVATAASNWDWRH